MGRDLNQADLTRLARSLNAKLASEARRRGVAPDLVRKQYIFTIFLSRIFQDEAAPWVLLGGNALLIRTGGGRFTQDIDLAREKTWSSVEEARDELQLLAARPYRDDPFDFDLWSATVHTDPDPYGYGAETGKLKVRSMLGRAVFETFNIDITTRRHVDGAIDRVPLQAVIKHHTLDALPAVPTTPVENHLADKICAMYETYGQGSKPSTRWRDLADVVRIVIDIPFDASRLVVVLAREAGRRQMTLPTAFDVPGELWTTEFAKAAAEFAEYPVAYVDLNAALEYVGACLNDVLAGKRTEGRWEPGTGWL